LVRFLHCSPSSSCCLLKMASTGFSVPYSYMCGKYLNHICPYRILFLIYKYTHKIIFAHLHSDPQTKRRQTLLGFFIPVPFLSLLSYPPCQYHVSWFQKGINILLVTGVYESLCSEWFLCVIPLHEQVPGVFSASICER
jgi:hypothetical protein